MYSDLLAKSYPSIKVDASLIFARDGNIYTSGGVTAGIDLALALIEEDVGPEVMLAVARTIVAFPRRPGGQSQFCGHSVMLDEHRDPFKPLLPSDRRPEFSDLQAWILAHPAADLTIPALANRMGMSERNFSRLFHSETGEPPAQFAERARAEAARCKLEQTLTPVETIAIECGFKNPERMRRSFQRLYETSPIEYRGAFSINRNRLIGFIDELTAAAARSGRWAHFSVQDLFDLHALRLKPTAPCRTHRLRA